MVSQTENGSTMENVVIAKRLLGQVLVEEGPERSDRREGRTILQEALSLAREKQYANEITWIEDLLERHF